MPLVLFLKADVRSKYIPIGGIEAQAWRLGDIGVPLRWTGACCVRGDPLHKDKDKAAHAGWSLHLCQGPLQGRALDGQPGFLRRTHCPDSSESGPLSVPKPIRRVPQSHL